MKVSVVVPVYNEEKYIEQCLNSIIHQVEKPDEIIIVDNNSKDRTDEIAKRFKEITIVKEYVQGMIPARNRGFNSATGDIIARTDADTIVPEDWIEKIKEEFEDSEVVGVSGPSKFYGISKIVDAAEWPSRLYFLTFKISLGHECLNGPNMAIRKSAWERIKDEICMDGKQVHEDIDLAIHLAKIGKIKFNFKLVVLSSFRRFKKVAPYFEYPYRYIRTIGKHRRLILLSDKRKKTFKRIFTKYSLKNSRFARVIQRFTN